MQNHTLPSGRPGYWDLSYEWILPENSLMALVIEGSSATEYTMTLYFFDCNQGEVVAVHSFDSSHYIILGTMGDKIVLAGYTGEYGMGKSQTSGLRKLAIFNNLNNILKDIAKQGKRVYNSKHTHGFILKIKE